MDVKRLSWLAIIALPVAIVNTLAWFGIFTFVNAYLTTQLGYSNEAWTATTLWLIGGMVVWPPLCTEFSARIGRRYTAMLGLASVVLFYLAIAYTANVWLIRVLLAMVALVQGTNSIGWLPMVAEYGGTHPGRAFAIVQIVGGAFAAVTLFWGGMLLAGAHYHQAFLAFGLVSAVCTAAFWLCSHRMESGTPPEVVSLRCVTKADLLSLVTGPFIMIILAGICIEPFNYHTVNQLYPNLTKDLFHLGNGQISTVVALGRLPGVISLFVIGHIVDRLNVVRCYGIGLATTGVVVLSMGMVPGSGLLIAAFFVYYLCHGSVWSTNLAAVNSTVTPRLRDSAFAIMSVTMTVAIFLVGIIHNRLLAAGLPLHIVFTCCGSVAVIGGIGLIAYSCSRHLAHHPSRQTAPVELADRQAEVS